MCQKQESVSEMTACEQFVNKRPRWHDPIRCKTFRKTVERTCFPSTKQVCEDRDVYGSSAETDRWMGSPTEKRTPKRKEE